MDRRELARLDRELEQYLGSMFKEMGRPERRRALNGYVYGLLLDGERKSIEPIAARLVEHASKVEAMRQRLQQCVTISTWSDAEVLRRLAVKLDRELPGVEALVIDDTGFPKKGRLSVGVSRQYSGTLGRVDNCQVAVSLHLAGEQGSGCIGMQLFLPEAWAEDPQRRSTAGVPDDVSFAHKWEIALKQLDAALGWGVRNHVVLADAGYGDCSEFRKALIERGLEYVVGVQGSHTVLPPGIEAVVPGPSGKPGRPKTYWESSEPPEQIRKLAFEIGRTNYRKVTWRQGSRGKQWSRFAALRVIPAENHRRRKAEEPAPMHWLLCEWPDDELGPTKFWLSNLPESTSLVGLVRLAKLRWRVERDYQDLKEEVGLDHFEGRTWRGFHHHVTLCAVAHAFLALQRALFPPQDHDVDTLAGPSANPNPASAPDRHMPSVQPKSRCSPSPSPVGEAGDLIR